MDAAICSFVLPRERSAVTAHSLLVRSVFPVSTYNPQTECARASPLSMRSESMQSEIGMGRGGLGSHSRARIDTSDLLWLLAIFTGVGLRPGSRMSRSIGTRPNHWFQTDLPMPFVACFGVSVPPLSSPHSLYNPLRCIRNKPQRRLVLFASGFVPV